MTITSNDPRWNNLGYWCHDAARLHPDRIAIIDLASDKPRQVTYRDLEDRLDRVARLLRDSNLQPADRLAMSVGNRFEFVEIFFGAMRAGIVPVPLNTKLGPETLDYVMRDAECVAAVVEESANPHVAPIAEAMACKTRLLLDGHRSGWRNYGEALEATPARFEPARLQDDHPSFQPYTSGSTGRPKGVVLTHAGQCWWIRCLQKYWPGQPENRALAAVPLYGDGMVEKTLRSALTATDGRPPLALTIHFQESSSRPTDVIFLRAGNANIAIIHIVSVSETRMAAIPAQPIQVDMELGGCRVEVDFE